MSQSGADGTQPWLSSGPAPDQQQSGAAEGPRPTQQDPAAEDPTVATPARRRPQLPPPQPSRGVQTPSPQPDPPPADPTVAAAVWQAQQQPTAAQQQPAAYQQPPAPSQLPSYSQPPAPAQQPPPYQQLRAYEPGPYGQPSTQHAQHPSQQGLPAFSVAVRAKRSSSARLLAATGGLVVAIVLVVLVVGFVAPGFFKTKELNVAAAQSGVQQVLSDKITGYGAANVDDVRCNNGENPRVEKGATFTCDVRIDGANRRVTATFVDDEGSYEVGPPK